MEKKMIIQKKKKAAAEAAAEVAMANWCNNHGSVSLPEEIIHGEILTRLPVKSVVRFGAVCKTWLNLFSTTEFMQSHLARRSNKKEFNSFIFFSEKRSGQVGHILTKISHDDRHLKILLHTLYDTFRENFVRHYICASLIGSINGLVCFCLKTSTLRDDEGEISVILCNPATRQLKDIPRLPKEAYAAAASGFGYFTFGYDSIKHDYKLFYMLDNTCHAIYSCNADSWNIQVSKPHDHLASYLSYGGRCPYIVNGCPYWSREKCNKSNLTVSVLCFDVQREAFRMLPKLVLGVEHCYDWMDRYCLANLEDNVGVALIRDSSSNHDVFLDVYVLDESCDMWINKYKFGPLLQEVDVLCECFNETIIFGHKGKKFLYDGKTNVARRFGSKIEIVYDPHTYLESMAFVRGMKPLEMHRHEIASFVRFGKRFSFFD